MKKTALVGLALLVANTTAEAGDLSRKLVNRALSSVAVSETKTYEAREVKPEDENKEPFTVYENKGNGFVLGDKYLTVDHTVTRKSNDMMTPFGRISIEIDVAKRETTLDGSKLESIVNDESNDVAVFKLNKEQCQKYCNKLKFSENIRIGEEVFYIGNPALTGKTLRLGHISRLNSPEGMGKQYEGSIGLSTYAVPGDSGGPVFNKRGEVIGVLQAVHSGIGYFRPMKFYKPYLTK